MVNIFRKVLLDFKNIELTIMCSISSGVGSLFLLNEKMALRVSERVKEI